MWELRYFKWFFLISAVADWPFSGSYKSFFCHYQWKRFLNSVEKMLVFLTTTSIASIAKMQRYLQRYLRGIPIRENIRDIREYKKTIVTQLFHSTYFCRWTNPLTSDPTLKDPIFIKSSWVRELRSLTFQAGVNKIIYLEVVFKM